MSLRLVFWEITKRCNLNCPHCRANSASLEEGDKLDREEIKRILREIAYLDSPLIVFSGGEPLVREDIFELCNYCSQLGLKPALATNGSLITQEIAQRLKSNKVNLVAVSLYGADSLSHNSFCGKNDAFQKARQGIKNLREEGINFQINTTITKKNFSQIEPLAFLSLEEKAFSYHIFFLVPTGRAKFLEGDELSSEEFEEAFKRILNLQKRFPSLRIKVTCAPHFHRVLAQNKVRHSLDRGCLAGEGVCFISYEGKVFGCGYLPLAAGDLKKDSFIKIWKESKLFRVLRDIDYLEGKCGRCEFKKICSGCRARAFAAGRNYLGEETKCVYQPLSVKS